MNEIFSIEHQYQLYLQRVKLNESDMGEVQKKELRQCFFAACGQMFFLLRDDIAALDEDAAIATLENMKNQVMQFFLKHKQN